MFASLALLLFSPTASDVNWHLLGQAPSNTGYVTAFPQQNGYYTLEMEGKRNRLVINGVAGPWGGKFATNLHFLPDGKTWFYSWRSEDGLQGELIVNGISREKGPYEYELFREKPFTYVRKSFDFSKQEIVIDGKVVAQGFGITPSFGPKGELVYQESTRDFKYTLVQDGKRQPMAEQSYLQWTADGKLVVECKGRVWIGGKELKMPGSSGTDKLERFELSGDRRHTLAIFQDDDDKTTVVIDNKVVGSVKGIDEYLTGREGRSVLIKREDESATGEDKMIVERYSATGVQRVSARPCKSWEEDTFFETADGKHYSVMLSYEKEQQISVVHDGEELFAGEVEDARKSFEDLTGLSPDGQHVCYALAKEGAKDIYVDGKLLCSAPDLLRLDNLQTFFWSPNSKSVAFVRKDGPFNLRLMIDGQSTEAAFRKDVNNGELRWLDSKTIRTVVIKDDGIYELTVRN